MDTSEFCLSPSMVLVQTAADSLRNYLFEILLQIQLRSTFDIKINSNLSLEKDTIFCEIFESQIKS